MTTEKKTRTPRDMALSLIVLMVPVFLLVLTYRFLYQGDTIVTVDPSEAIASAQRAGMSQLPPNTAPEGWLIVNAHFRDGVLRIGYLTKDRGGVQLAQSKTDLAATAAAKPGETRLLGRSGDVTVVVIAEKGADAGPLARMLPIPVNASAGP